MNTPEHEALRRLGGGRWETRDRRFAIEPQSGTWVVVDRTQTDELGLPLTRGPFPSLAAARAAIDQARTDGTPISPLASHLAEARRTRAAAGKSKSARASTPTPEPAPVLPPEPAWLRDLGEIDRRRARDLIRRLDAAGLAPAERIARDEFDGKPALAKAALERLVNAIAARDPEAIESIRAVLRMMLAGEDTTIGAAWRLVDAKGVPITGIDIP